jgi:hypothetical protein
MKKQKRKVPRWIYWTPRILSIVFLCFLALMSLDVFEPGLSAGQIALGLFMHNIPVLLLAIVLWVSWKYEIVGGIAFILGGLLYIAQLIFNAMTNGFEGYMISWAIQIAGVAFFIGILFLMNWYKKK